MKRKAGKLLMTIGLLLIAAAFLLMVYNIWESKKAENMSEEILNQIKDGQDENVSSDDADEKPLYEIYPDMEMPVLTIDGVDYIGILTVPSLGLELPVAGNWSYPNLRRSPCRYKGSAYSNDMIIAGHNYSRHFGGLKNLAIGEEISFRDVDGHIFQYQVDDIETIPGTAVEDMHAGEWDMTLFTCTYGGKSRVTIRCRKLENDHSVIFKGL
ncbi:sortase [Faecalicatena contorta]|uniref:sortase n=1 Tax=Lachnospiraceae TaxID=186803 RepID=UPI001F182B26|nr:sortase [Faecalicatena contorta]MCF2669323.1 sortase [Faecalicatena contorta]